jgi:hypothetical protein
MPGWGEIQDEFLKSLEERRPLGLGPDADGIRRKYLKRLSTATGRPAILYASAWLNRPNAPDISITLQDVHGLMVACQDIAGRDLDLIIHSPGGSAEGTASLVHYLRQRFDDIRVFVPLAAMSAATMWALAADRVVLGEHSQLGPIDPQFIINDRNGQRLVAASAILDQFKQAKKETGDDSKTLAAWAQILPQYGPGLLQQCEAAAALSKKLVSEWLAQYMFRGAADATQKGLEVAEFFGAPETHQSHSMGIFREQLREKGLTIDDLEGTFQDEILSVFHATTLTTTFTPCVKLVENSDGRGYFTMMQQQLSLPMQLVPQPPTPQQQAPQQPLSRQQRRALQRRKPG